MIDLEKLTPAPWFECHCKECCGIDNDEFITLARNAFDVMMRRGWHAIRIMSGPWAGGWFVKNDLSHALADLSLPHCWPDPFTALVEADEWYVENVEKK